MLRQISLHAPNQDCVSLVFQTIALFEAYYCCLTLFGEINTGLMISAFWFISLSLIFVCRLNTKRQRKLVHKQYFIN